MEEEEAEADEEAEPEDKASKKKKDKKKKAVAEVDSLFALLGGAGERWVGCWEVRWGAGCAGPVPCMLWVAAFYPSAHLCSRYGWGCPALLDRCPWEVQLTSAGPPCRPIILPAPALPACLPALPAEEAEEEPEEKPASKKEKEKKKSKKAYADIDVAALLAADEEAAEAPAPAPAAGGWWVDAVVE